MREPGYSGAYLQGEPVTPEGKTPAVILVNPHNDHNVAGALRACSAFGVNQLWVTGYRLSGEMSPKGKMRLPRELRMKLYEDVSVCYYDYPFDAYKGSGASLIAVEISPAAQSLTYFTHPRDAVYVFGPEDGSLSSVQNRHCTDFVQIPTKVAPDGKPVCVNLAAAVNIVLADRHMMDERGMIGE
jgi:tRNA(Leu) C34 or U34 (ribose-2'-O)-methylase TrmL